MKEDEGAFAQSVVDMQKEAKEAGYYTIDELGYQGRMTEWTPKWSSRCDRRRRKSCIQKEKTNGLVPHRMRQGPARLH